MKRILLMQQPGPDAEARVQKLQAEDCYVVDVDPFHLHWTKMIEAGQWHAIMVHHSCFELILGELAAELAMSYTNTETKVVLISDGRKLDLPSSLISAEIQLEE
jgi:hypothetical protein